MLYCRSVHQPVVAALLRPMKDEIFICAWEEATIDMGEYKTDGMGSEK